MDFLRKKLTWAKKQAPERIFTFGYENIENNPNDFFNNLDLLLKGDLTSNPNIVTLEGIPFSSDDISKNWVNQSEKSRRANELTNNAFVKLKNISQHPNLILMLVNNSSFKSIVERVIAIFNSNTAYYSDRRTIDFLISVLEGLNTLPDTHRKSPQILAVKKILFENFYSKIFNYNKDKEELIPSHYSWLSILNYMLESSLTQGLAREFSFYIAIRNEIMLDTRTLSEKNEIVDDIYKNKNLETNSIINIDDKTDLNEINTIYTSFKENLKVIPDENIQKLHNSLQKIIKYNATRINSKFWNLKRSIQFDDSQFIESLHDVMNKIETKLTQYQTSSFPIRKHNNRKILDILDDVIYIKMVQNANVPIKEKNEKKKDAMDDPVNQEYNIIIPLDELNESGSPMHGAILELDESSILNPIIKTKLDRPANTEPNVEIENLPKIYKTQIQNFLTSELKLEKSVIEKIYKKLNLKPQTFFDYINAMKIQGLSLADKYKAQFMIFYLITNDAEFKYLSPKLDTLPEELKQFFIDRLKEI